MNQQRATMAGQGEELQQRLEKLRREMEEQEEKRKQMESNFPQTKSMPPSFERQPSVDDSSEALAGKKQAIEGELNRLRKEVLNMRESLTQEMDGKRAQMRALDEEAALQRRKVDREMQVNASLMKDVEQRRALLRQLDDEILHRQIALSELRSQEQHQRNALQTASNEGRGPVSPYRTRDQQWPEERRRLEGEVTRLTDDIVKLEMECSRLTHALQKQQLHAKEMEKVMAQGKESYQALAQERDKHAQEVAAMTRTLVDLRDQATTVCEKQRRAGVTVPPIRGRFDPNLRVDVSAILEALQGQCVMSEQFQQVATDATLRARKETEGKMQNQTQIVQQLNTRLEESEKIRSMLEIALKGENAAKLHAENRIKMMEQQLKVVRAEAEAQLSRLSDERENLGSHFEEIHRRLEEAQAGRQELEKYLSEANEAIGRQQTELTKLRTAAASTADASVVQGLEKRLAIEIQSRRDAEARLASLVHSIPGGEQQELENQLKEAKQRLAEAETNNRQLQQELETIYKKLGTSEQRVINLSHELADAKIAVTLLTKSEMICGQLQTALRNEGEAKIEAQERARGLEKQVTDAQQQLNESDARSRQLLQELTKLKNDLVDAEQRIAGLSASPTMAQERDVLGQKLEAVLKREADVKAEAEDRISKLQQQLTTAQQQVVESEARNQKMQDELNGLRKDLKDAKDRITTLNNLVSESSRISPLLEESETTRSKLQAALKGESDAREAAEQKGRTLTQQLAESEARAKKAEEDLDDLQEKLIDAEKRLASYVTALSEANKAVPLLEESETLRNQLEAALVFEVEAKIAADERARTLEQQLKGAQKQLADSEMCCQQAKDDLQKVQKKLKDAEQQMALINSTLVEAGKAVPKLEESEMLRKRLQTALQNEADAKAAAERRIRALEEQLQVTQSMAEGKLSRLMKDQRSHESPGTQITQPPMNQPKSERDTVKAVSAAAVDPATVKALDTQLASETKARQEAEAQLASLINRKSKGQRLEKLLVTVSHGEGLADSKGSCDPYVTLQVGQQKQQTSVKVNTGDPLWHETFVFENPNGPLQVLLQDDDLALPFEPMGSAVVPLDESMVSRLRNGQVRQWVPTNSDSGLDTSGVVLLLEGVFSGPPDGAPLECMSSTSALQLKAEQREKQRLQEACTALQAQIQVLETKLQQKDEEEQNLREQLEERDILHCRTEALIREELDAKINELEELLEGSPEESSAGDDKLNLRVVERRLKEKESEVKQLEGQLRDMEIEICKLEARLRDKQQLEEELALTSKQLVQEEGDVAMLQRELRTMDLAVKDATLRALQEDGQPIDPMQRDRMLQEYLQQLEEEVRALKTDLQNSRLELQQTHRAVMHNQEELLALEVETQMRKSDVEALKAEVAAKRETALRLVTEQISPTETRIQQLSQERLKLELQVEALRQQQETKQADVDRTEAMVRSLDSELQQKEDAIVDLRRQLAHLSQQLGDENTRLRIMQGETEAKRLEEGKVAMLPSESSAESSTSRQLTLPRLSDMKPKPITADQLNPFSLVVQVLNASRLVRVNNITGRSDPVVTMQFGPEARRTNVRRNTLDPEWNETFEFQLALGELEFQIWDDDVGRHRELMGVGSISIDQQLVNSLRSGPLKQMVPLTLRGADAGDINISLTSVMADKLPIVESLPPALMPPENSLVAAPTVPPERRISVAPPSRGRTLSLSAQAPPAITAPPTQVATTSTPAKPRRTRVTPLDEPRSYSYVDFEERTSREPSLHFKEPDVKYLRVRILEGVCPIMDFDGLCDPYVSVDTGLMKWDTKVQKETLTPAWFQEAVIGCYNVQNVQEWGLRMPDELINEEVNITVYDWNVTTDRRIGFIQIKYRDIPGYEGDDIVDPPEPFWYEAERHFGVVTQLVNSDVGKWFATLMFDEKTRRETKQQKRKLAVVTQLEKRLDDVAGQLQGVGKTLESQLQEGIRGVETHVNKIRDLFKTDEERKIEAALPVEKEGEEDDDDLLSGDRSLCTIKAQIWFDNTYTPPPVPFVGQLTVKICSLDLDSRENGTPRDPFVIINYGRHWVRLPTVFANRHAVFGQEYLFGISEPANVLTLAIFDDSEHQNLTLDPKFLGLLRIRPTCLSSNKKYHATLPVQQRYKGKVKERGTITFVVSLTLNHVLPMVVAMFRPPMKDKYYDLPLNAFKTPLTGNEPIDFDALVRVKRFQNLVEIASKQGPEWHPKAVRRVLGPPNPELDLDLVQAHGERLKQGFRIIVRFIDYLEYICLWQKWQESLAVNVTLVLLVCYAEWLPTVVTFYLLYSFTRGLYRRKENNGVAPMDAQLFGNVVTKRGPKEEEEDEEKEEKPGKEEEGPETSTWEDIKKVLNTAVMVQEYLGLAASMVERIDSLPRWGDPRISGLLCCTFAFLIPALYYIPLKLVISFVIVFVLRHPSLRDPIPPPPVNLLERLPTRAPLLLPKEK